jgi:ABC-2 type transport system ATP-binding protein
MRPSRRIYRSTAMSVIALPDRAEPVPPGIADAVPVIEVDDLERHFGEIQALRGVSLEVRPGEIHGLLGPNGAGKTTLMRVLSGLVEPSGGTAYVLDRRAGRSRDLRRLIGFVPAGERTFYQRLSGLENLVFFARLHGMRKRAANHRALEALEAVGLADAARRPINSYSHGMQKRMSFARALLTDPPVLLVDEATDGLDPTAAHQVRELTRARAAAGAAVLWATQRVEELPGFADSVSLLERGQLRFTGSVGAFAAEAGGGRHLLRLDAGGMQDLASLQAALGDRGRVEPARDADPSHVMLDLAGGVPLGAAIAALATVGANVVSCRDERPPIERAFLAMTQREHA